MHDIDEVLDLVKWARKFRKEKNASPEVLHILGTTATVMTSAAKTGLSNHLERNAHVLSEVANMLVDRLIYPL